MKQSAIVPKHQQILHSAGFQTYDDFMSPKNATQIRDQGNGQQQAFIIKATYQGTCYKYFLKTNRREKAKSIYKPLLGLRAPTNMAMREKYHLDAISAAGFDAMEPIAWGYRSNLLGYANEGFLVVAEVKGLPLERYIEQHSRKNGLKALHMLGRLTAQYHQAGFFKPIRVQDTICQSSENGSPERLVMIDRDNSYWWRAPKSHRRAIQILSRTLARTHRVEPQTKAGYIAFIKGYLDSPKLTTEGKALVADVLKEYQRIGPKG